jgi:hypothetical protein
MELHLFEPPQTFERGCVSIVHWPTKTMHSLRQIACRQPKTE